MSVDISELIPSLQREVSPPGSNLYPAATDDDWLGHLQDAFWEARLQGLLPGYKLDTIDDSLIVPISGTEDLDRRWQQLIVLFAGYRITLTQFQNVNSGFRAKAGPVEFERQKSATTLKAVLDAIRDRIKVVIDSLPGVPGEALVYAFEGYIERTYAVACGENWYVR